MYSLVIALVRWSLNLFLQRLICCCLCVPVSVTSCFYVSVSVASCFYVSVSAASCEVQDHLHHLVDTITLHVVSLWLFSGRGGGGAIARVCHMHESGIFVPCLLSLQEPTPLPYLQHSDEYSFDINLQVAIQGKLFLFVPVTTMQTSSLVLQAPLQPHHLLLGYFSHSFRVKLLKLNFWT